MKGRGENIDSGEQVELKGSPKGMYCCCKKKGTLTQNRGELKSVPAPGFAE